MQPHNSLTHSTNKTIYINPNFKSGEDNAAAILQAATAIPRNTHINPLFLGGHKHKPTIHMNPAFYLKFQEQQIQKQQSSISTQVRQGKSNKFRYTRDPNSATSSSSAKCSTLPAGKIICKSKNRLIREPLVKNVEQPIILLDPPIPQSALLVLNKRRLIRKPSTTPTKNTVIEPLKRNVNSKLNRTKYKVDNRVIRKKSILPPTPKIKRTSYVGRYSLRRTSLSLTYSPGNKKTLNSTTNKSLNKKLQLLNINGVLYKSTRNSLKLREMTSNPTRTLKPSKPITSSQTSLPTKQSPGLTIFVRGTKYVMDSNKFKLTRVTDSVEQSSPNKAKTNKTTAPCRRRIDIGGYTYILASAAKNVFLRSTNHLARAYVHNAKQKSLQMLTKRWVKSNIPCPIYQRVGKCAAFERGKCSKVHNKLQVAICNKFLRGECLDSKCLLSHNVSLSKMPVCKFFLQGVCVRNDCPYLHKKLSNNAEICIDFIRGFCQLADKCNKRHEFACPQVERNLACTTKNCMFCKSKQWKDNLLKIALEKLENDQNQNDKQVECSPATNEATSKEPPSSLRYFVEPCDIVEKTDKVEQENEEDNIEDSSIENEEHIKRARPKLGALPAFIPL